MILAHPRALGKTFASEFCVRARPHASARAVGFSFSSDVTKHDEDNIKVSPVPALFEGGIASRIVVVLNNGQRFDTQRVVSGTSGPHAHQWYGTDAQKGHKNDAEIRALHVLHGALPPPTVDGTCYVLGTDGPCDSCKAVLATFRKQFPQLQFKYFYRRLDAKNVTQDVATAYGWAGDTAKSVGEEAFYYHYVPARSVPEPLNEKDRANLLFAETTTLGQIGRGVALKDLQLQSLGLTKKASKAFTERIRQARWEAQIAVNMWGERRRFGREESDVAATNVLRLKEDDLCPLGKAEFIRRVERNARAGAFGNWYADE